MAFSFATIACPVLADIGATPPAPPSPSQVEIRLPRPEKTGGRTLGEALSARRSCRAYSDKDLDRQTLSDLLWATAGVNRPDDGRTAPSAYGAKAVELYVVLDQGVYRYQPSEHRLSLLLAGNFQKQTGMQPFVEKAPVNLLYVADFSKLSLPSSEKRFLHAVDGGAMCQNASLFCASSGLGTVVRAGIDGRSLEKALGLPENKRILFAQTVGWPAE